MYYFGARYYDPRTSVWQSADPILGKYLPNNAGKDIESYIPNLSIPFTERGGWRPDRDLPGGGGVYLSGNLAMYSYTLNNPVLLTDPTGEVWYNPTSWDWKKISSGFKGKAGIGPGLHAKVKISKLTVSAGIKATLGVWREGQEDGGLYLTGAADILRASFGKENDKYYASGSAGYKYDLKINLDQGTYTEQTDGDFFSGKIGGKKGKAKNSMFGDWLEIGGSYTAGAYELGGAVNFGTILEGIIIEPEE